MISVDVRLSGYAGVVGIGLSYDGRSGHTDHFLPVSDYLIVACCLGYDCVRYSIRVSVVDLTPSDIDYDFARVRVDMYRFWV